MDSARTSDRHPTPKSQRLGAILRDARIAKGLELRDVSEVTHVRKEYLKALDEGRYEDLPEDVYARNFVRLYAQALGLDEGDLLRKFKEERHPETLRPEHRVRPERVAEEAEAPKYIRAKPASLPRTRIVPKLENVSRLNPWRGGEPSLDPDFWSSPRGYSRPLLIALAGAFIVLAALAIAWWATGRAFPTATEGTPAEASITGGMVEAAAAAPAAPAVEEVMEANGLILFSISSEPPGAEVTIDGFFVGTTPIYSAPLRAGANRLVEVSLEGYQTAQLSESLATDRTLEVALVPISDVVMEAQVHAEEQREAVTEVQVADGASAVTGQGTIVLQIEATTWLEAYSGSARGEGEKLFYTMAHPGETLEFPLPVYLHVGNAGGIQATISGEDQGRLGLSGEVVSRVFE